MFFSGDILVASQFITTNKQQLKKASAFITEKDGRTSPIALLARELGIPAVVGTRYATTQLKSHQMITVNGTTGEIYQGSLTTSAHPLRRTATRIFTQITEPKQTHLLTTPGDGLFITANQPDILLNDTHKQFSTSPLLYRLTDTTSENKKDLLGYHGTYRLLTEPKQLKEELYLLKQFLTHSSLTLVVPYVRNINELKEIKHHLTQAGLTRTTMLKLWMEIALPSNIFLLDDFIQVGIDGLIINTDILTMLLLGTDRKESFVAHAYDDLDQSVLKCIEQVITTAKRHNIHSSIYGHTPSHHPSLIENLVTWGITSIVVEHDKFSEIQKQISKTERNLLERF